MSLPPASVMSSDDRGVPGFSDRRVVTSVACVGSYLLAKSRSHDVLIPTSYLKHFISLNHRHAICNLGVGIGILFRRCFLWIKVWCISLITNMDPFPVRLASAYIFRLMGGTSHSHA